MIDLADEIKKILEEDYTHILVRHLSEIKCNCWRETSQTPDPNCPRCKGTGWVFYEFIQKCYLTLVSQARVAHAQDFMYGKSYSNSMTCYLPVNDLNKLIKLDDQLFEVEEVAKGRYKRAKKWVVTDVLSYKAENNKIQFIKLLAKPVVV